MARKNAATSVPPTLPRNVPSGGKVTMRQIDPRGGGSMRCGSVSAARACLIATGVLSVTQTRVETKPGRAGLVRTSPTGPSSIATDLPPASSMVTIRRTAFGPSVIDAVPCPKCGLEFARISLVKLCSHHHERHQARGRRVGPAVPIAELHHHIARLHDDLAAVEHEHALAR